MLRDDVLALLKQHPAPLSGEGMSRALGVSRAAVWKAMEALRREGYDISSAPNRGYCLDASPDALSAGELSGALSGRLLGREVRCLTTVDSTNREAKRAAESGAAEGLVVLADEQTAGRGRRGRSFASPAGRGLYLSVLLRPQCPLPQLMELTAWAAVAVCGAVETVCGVRPGIKWTNDIVLDGKKLCGILTELGMEGETAEAQYVVLGLGINVSQTVENFGAELAPIATSLALSTGGAPRRAELAAAVIAALDDMYAAFPQERSRYLERYREDCLSTGREVRLVKADGTWEDAVAEEINGDFALVVRDLSGVRRTVNAGEVSVRGLFGYA